MPAQTPPDADSPAVAAGQYMVVARRYRPQSFVDLVGQEPVAKALAGAIASQRVGHAYLFTGARGVGKTSTARILAKALNCEKGPTSEPCNECEICRSITSGDDVDVLEIDGASNRGIDEIRQLRQNVNVRPSRARYKIYIIDEVHMLTRDAFNALLKTLEEPPAHVKFIFCTTEPEKIPITVLSRCQRFDFAGIQSQSIAQRLEQIVDAEKVTVEPAALQLLARRAAGSMRDSQSLLEQLLAFGQDHITVADVHQMLGSASDQRLSALVESLAKRDGAACLETLDQAVAEGIDLGQMIDQLLGYFRDLMVAAVGGKGEMLLHIPNEDQDQARQYAQQLGLETILAAMQILDQAMARMRVSPHRRVLVELAIVRICQLEKLDELSELVARLSNGAAPAGGSPPARPAGEKKNPEPLSRASSHPAPSAQPAGSSSPAGNPSPDTSTSAPTAQVAAKETEAPPRSSSVPENGSTAAASTSSDHSKPASSAASAKPNAGGPRTDAEAQQLWSKFVRDSGDILSGHAAKASRVAISAPNRLVVTFRESYNFHKTYCENPEHKLKLEKALSEIAGVRIALEFVQIADSGSPATSVPVKRSTGQKLRECAERPFVKKAAEVFGAYPVGVDESPGNPNG